MTSTYDEFIKAKFQYMQPTGILGEINLKGDLYDFQKALTRWALKKGKSAIFADTGLGKMRMELAWADAVSNYTSKPVMIHTPLAVAAQIESESNKMGIKTKVCREQSDLIEGINITNYERLHKFDPSIFSGVVLDESSCIKHQSTKTFNQLNEAYKNTLFKLPATATPAPNDWVELGTHAEFLGICTQQEMLSEFFTHDGGETSVWRLKGHARAIFWKWVSSWGAMIRKPSDLGFYDSKYILPPLKINNHVVDYEMPANGMLFSAEAQTLSERRNARKNSLESRVDECSKIVNSSDDIWVVWCDLNAEGDLLENKIQGSVQLSGADDIDKKERILKDFSEGKIRVLISKPSICGWGLNWQHSCNMAFVGVTDSYEAYYQAVRRQWRFGQKMPVNVHIFSSKAEGNVIDNLKRKQQDAEKMADSLSAETRDSVMKEVTGTVRETNLYSPSNKVIVPSFLG